MRAVGVIGSAAVLRCGDDIRELSDIVLCETISGGLGGSCLKVVEIAVLLLIVGEALTHMVEDFLGELLSLLVGHIRSEPLGVETDLVHADEADGREVVLESTEVASGVGIETLVEKLRDNRTLNAERTGGDIHKLVESAVEVRLILCKICDSRHIYRDNAYRTGALAAAEEAAGLLAKLAQVEAQSAAHGADIARLHIAVDVVREIRCAVLCGHLEEKSVVLSIRPVKVAGYGISRDGILEAASVGVALDHGLDERLVDHIHLFLAILVLEGHLLAADNGVELSKVVGNGPVKGYIRERSLSAPATGGVDAEDERLDALLDLAVREVVRLNKRGEIGIERGERLSARPLVLHDTEEVDHLVAEGRKVACGRRGYLSGDAAETFLNELLQRPARAVTGEHGEVMEMDVAVSVGVCYLFVIDLGEPVVRGDRAGVAENQSADGICDGRILFNAPVGNLDVAVNQLLVVEDGRLHVSDFFALLSVENIGLCDIGVARLAEHRLDAVLNVLNGDKSVLDLALEVRSDLECEQVDDRRMSFLVERVESL